MPALQRTIGSTTGLEGTGLHSGERSRVTFRPAPENTGVVFRRVDLDDTREIPALVENTVQVERATALVSRGTRVRTVEHTLAAIAGLGLDNVYVDLDTEEPPALDGSAQPFADCLHRAGIRRQDAPVPEWTCREPFALAAGDASYAIVPDERYVVAVSIEYDHPLISRQHSSYVIDEESFAAEIAPARTFGLLDDAEHLRAAGLALGAGIENTVVLTQQGLYDGVELRFEDEFARHKLLDVIGDLALVGSRIKAKVVAERPGHLGNIELARAIRRRASTVDAAKIIDINKILEILPHRYPFLLVDRVKEYDKGKRIVGLKNVTINEPFFVGHFPGLPIMPGVLIIEAMAQVGGLLLMDTIDDPENKVVYFMSLDKVKFRRPVTPGDQIEFELEMLRIRGATCRMKGIGRVDGQVVAEAEMMAQVVDR